MSSVGLIVNPVSGRDIRRLVAQAWVVPQQEKVAIVTRLLGGLRAAGVERVLSMPEPRGICREAAQRAGGNAPRLDELDMPVTGSEADSTAAASSMAEQGVACIVTLGGDGTNRAVFKGCRATSGAANAPNAPNAADGPPGIGTSDSPPLLPISSGTNNVFPSFHEGTSAGYAAGLLATGQVTRDAACYRHKAMQVVRLGGGHAGDEDLALVDIAFAREPLIGARALWDIARIGELFLTRAEPWNVGLSSIGAKLHPTPLDAPRGLHIVIGPGGRRTLAPIVPGRYEQVEIQSAQPMLPGDAVTLSADTPGTLALDGERTMIMRQGESVSISLVLEGPWVLDVPRTIGAAAPH